MFIFFKKQTEEGQWWADEESANESEVSEAADSYVDDDVYVIGSEGDDWQLNEGASSDEGHESDVLSIVADDYVSDENDSTEPDGGEIVLEISDSDMTCDDLVEEEMIAEDSDEESEEEWFLDTGSSGSKSVESQEVVLGITHSSSDE